MLYATLSWWLAGQVLSPTARIVVLTGFIAMLAVIALLFYGARQASVSRELDAETLRADLEKRTVEQLQQALVQQQLPVVANVRFSATYSPATVGSNVGGDWYDAFELPHGRIMFSIGDVAGHGIEAAATMSRARHAIVAAALQDSDPAAILTRTNARLLSEDAKFITAMCGYVNPGTLEVVYATAGHPPAILIDAGGAATLLQYGGLPLGVQPDGGYCSRAFTATPNSILVLYTDGLLEYDRDLIEGERRMLRAASDMARERTKDPADAIRRAIFAEYEPRDDVAILTVSFRDESGLGDQEDDAERWSVGLRGVRAPFDGG